MKDKIVVVTGAGRNTGLALAQNFHARGAQVCVNDLDRAQTEKIVGDLNRLSPGRALAIPGDISQPNQVEEMFSRVRDRYRRVDLLVNNAAQLGLGFTSLDMPPLEWQRVIAVNVNGTFFCSQQAAKLMRKGSVIINLSSNLGARALRNRSAYCSSKGAIHALTRALAVDLAYLDIRVNELLLGYVRTKRWENLSQEQVEQRRGHIPLGKETLADDVAEAIAFLASSRAGKITGASLTVDGGCDAQYLPQSADTDMGIDLTSYTREHG